MIKYSAKHALIDFVNRQILLSETVRFHNSELPTVQGVKIKNHDNCMWITGEEYFYGHVDRKTFESDLVDEPLFFDGTKYKHWWHRIFFKPKERYVCDDYPINHFQEFKMRTSKDWSIIWIGKKEVVKREGVK